MAKDLRVDGVAVASEPVRECGLDNALLRKRLDVFERPFDGRTPQNAGEWFTQTHGYRLPGSHP